jgi:preprotein translocase subunit SecY
MKKNGGFIPGIRLGQPTSSYISKVVSRITVAGAAFYSIIALIPILIGWAID